MPAKGSFFSSNHWSEILDRFDSFCCFSQKHYKTEVKRDEECSLPYKHEISIEVVIRDTKG